MFNSSSASLFSGFSPSHKRSHPLTQAATSGKDNIIIQRLSTTVANAAPSFLNQMRLKINKEKYKLEDGRLTKILFDRVQVSDFVSFILALLSVSLTIVQYEFEYAEDEEYSSNVLLYLIFFSSILLSLATGVRHYFNYQYLKARRLASKRRSLFKFKFIAPIVSEICFAMVIPYPWTRGEIVEAYSLYDNRKYYYHQNEILTLFSLLRIAIVLRIFWLHSYWSSNRAQRLCNMASLEGGMLFTLKCAMRTNPLSLIFSVLVSGIPTFGYMLYIAERPITRGITDVESYSYPNSMWNMIITISSVGFGDLAPQTLLGRIIVFFVCIWGTIVTSLMVVAVENLFHLTFPEEKMFGLLDRLRLKDIMKAEAASMMANLFRGKKVSNSTGRVSHYHVNQVKEHLKNFQKARDMYQNCTTSGKGFEDMERYIEFLREQVQELRSDLKYLVSSMNGVLDSAKRTKTESRSEKNSFMGAIIAEQANETKREPALQRETPETKYVSQNSVQNEETGGKGGEKEKKFKVLAKQTSLEKGTGEENGQQEHSRQSESDVHGGQSGVEQDAKSEISLEKKTTVHIAWKGQAFSRRSTMTDKEKRSSNNEKGNLEVENF